MHSFLGPAPLNLQSQLLAFIVSYYSMDPLEIVPELSSAETGSAISALLTLKYPEPVLAALQQQHGDRLPQYVLGQRLLGPRAATLQLILRQAHAGHMHGHGAPSQPGSTASGPSAHQAAADPSYGGQLGPLHASTIGRSAANTIRCTPS